MDSVVLETKLGDIQLGLFRDQAPMTCDNSTELVRRGYYDGIKFHRVIYDFMVQSGDPTGTGRGGKSIYGHNFEDEIYNACGSTRLDFWSCRTRDLAQMGRSSL